MKNEHPSVRRRWQSFLGIAARRGFVAGSIVLVLALALLLFIDPLVNRFVKPKVSEAFAKAYPAYSMRVSDMDYSVLNNRFGIDGVDVRKVDGSFSGTMRRFSVGGIGWFHLLWGGELSPKDFADADIDAQEVKVNLSPSHYTAYCRTLHVSIPDSEVVAQSFNMQPKGNDEEFFAESNIRRTRYHLDVPYAKANGFASLEMAQGKGCRIRSVQIRDAVVDILLDKDKPYVESTPPLMPNEMFASIEEPLNVSHLTIINGELKYAERMRLGSVPGVITFDSVQASATGISNRGGREASVVIHAQGRFMKAGTMKVLMSIPVSTKEFSYEYSGSLSKMNADALNAFLEAGEQMRIKRGVLDEATFGITVVSGQASGTVRMVYRDLTFAVINKYTGSEKGIFDMASSIIANTFKFRRNNVPGKSGAMKIGQVKHSRQRDEYFMEFTWFALRSGVGNVIGF